MGIFSKIKYRTCSFKERAEMLRKAGVKIGEQCEIFPNVIFGSEPYLVEIGDHVRLTSGVKITTHDGGLWVLRCDKKLKNADRFGKVTIGNNVHIGIDSIIMPNVTIGDNVIIGCGAVVTKDIPPDSVAVGVPARVIESIEDYRKKVEKDVTFTKSMTPEEKKQYLTCGTGGVINCNMLSLVCILYERIVL